MKYLLQNPTVVLALLSTLLAPSLHAALGNVWHIATNAQDGIPSTMREPAFPGANENATFYQGVWKGDGANQTGGFLVYRVNNGTWQSAALGFHSDVEPGTGDHNQFWKAAVTMPPNPGDTFDYYFIVDFDNRDRTYLYGNNFTTPVENDAKIQPTSFPVAYPTPELTVNGTNSNYSKSNFYIDENNDITFPVLQLRLDPGLASVADAQIFTNLNNRERADEDYNNDGIEDGIIPVDGNTITTADTGAYFQAYPMTDSNSDGIYELDLDVLNTGAYRVTARYRVNPGDPWIWLGDSGIRDHAVVVAPTDARDMRIYELHVANSNATGPTFAERGTFEDLYDPNERINIDWLNDLGMNWIWFQPFHPQGLDGRQIDPATGSAYDPGSPYSIRNFWEINPLYTAAYNGSLPDPVANPANYDAAMTAFQNFAAAADSGGVQLMLDFPFNHTAPDVVLGQKGVEIFGGTGNPSGWSPNDEIRIRVPQFFSTNGGEGPAAYSAPAQSAAGLAVAPDRDDFGKWSDVRDVFFGRYATLVTGYPGADSSRATIRNEGDWMDYSSMGPETIGVWRYFGEVLPYWIKQSGHRGYNSTPADGANRDALDRAGIDGLRKDFGQGLPPQAMEYIINRTHEVKWNFVFMTESLDGSEITYRSSRHFAVLNENIVFPLQAATTTPGYRGIFDERRNAYGQSLVLLNNTSHDEAPYADSWEALIRYATVSSNDGAPMIMYGQEIGTGQKFQESLPQGGFDWYETNFGKNIPHFKKWNSMQPQWNAWTNNELGTQFLFPVYSAIGKAREFSSALRSSNRWYLNPQGSLEPDPDIFAVAKYSEANTPLPFQDVVLAFTNLRRDNFEANTFGITSGLADLLGLSSGRTYNIKNISAYTGRNNEQATRRDAWLWGVSGRSRDDIVNNGIFVSLNPVPSTDAAWETAPYEAQFLKVYDVTPPPAPTQPANASGKSYVVGDAVTFDWDPSPFNTADDNIASYKLIVKRVGSDETVFDQNVGDVTSYEYTGAYGDDLYAFVVPVSVAGVEGAASTASASVQILNPSDDEDGDGWTNAEEELAGTDLFDNSSRFEIADQTIAPNGDVTITWTPQPDRSYTIETRTDLASGSWNAEATGQTSGSWTDTPGENVDKKFYRLVLE
jgi:hypothetical protein